jgi:hypothetical protein
MRGCHNGHAIRMLHLRSSRGFVAPLPSSSVNCGGDLFISRWRNGCGSLAKWAHGTVNACAAPVAHGSAEPLCNNASFASLHHIARATRSPRSLALPRACPWAKAARWAVTDLSHIFGPYNTRQFESARGRRGRNTLNHRRHVDADRRKPSHFLGKCRGSAGRSRILSAQCEHPGKRNSRDPWPLAATQQHARRRISGKPSGYRGRIGSRWSAHVEARH